MTAKQVRGQYTQEFKLEGVRQVHTGQAIAVVAKVLDTPKASLGNGCNRHLKPILPNFTESQETLTGCLLRAR